MKASILIVDDDEKLNQLLTSYLSDFEFKVDSATSPSAGFKKLVKNPIDLIILDVMLPEMNGFEMCKEIRKNYAIRIIMLTARGDLMDRVVGLELGADDYLPKPFEPRELVARIQAVLRRGTQQAQSSSSEKQFGHLKIDFEKQHVYLSNQKIELTTNEFAALKLLCKHPGKVMSRDQILDRLHGIEYDAFNRSVDITMSRLRQKLKDNPKSPEFIKTIWGTGYTFIGKE